MFKKRINLGSAGQAVFNLGLQQRGPTGPIQPKIGGHLEKEGALTYK